MQMKRVFVDGYTMLPVKLFPSTAGAFNSVSYQKSVKYWLVQKENMSALNQSWIYCCLRTISWLELANVTWLAKLALTLVPCWHRLILTVVKTAVAILSENTADVHLTALLFHHVLQLNESPAIGTSELATYTLNCQASLSCLRPPTAKIKQWENYQSS